jgi:hypothetical protein
MTRIHRQLRGGSLLAMLLLVTAGWLQVAHPLLLAGHLAACADAEGCRGGCRHPAGEELAFTLPMDGSAPAEHRHDPLHCVLCRTLQLAGKAVAAEAGTDIGLHRPAAADQAVPAPDRAATRFLDAGGPRGPPSC